MERTREAALPVGARPRLPPTERRALIVAAAAEAFADSGYEGTTLEAIARAAGVTKPILYRHFDSKKDLYLALLRRHRDDLPSFLEIAQPAESADPQVRVILDGWFEYAQRNSHGWRMLFRDRGGDAEIAALRREVEERARGVLVSWLGSQPQARIPRSELEPTAEIIRAGLAGLVLWWIDHPQVPRRRLVAAAERLLTPVLG